MPTPETVTRALEQIAKSAANYQYFFQKLTSPAWLQPLAEKGRFKAPPPKQPVEGGVSFPGLQFFDQSTLVTLPFRVTGLLESNSAEKEWCANIEAAESKYS